MLDSKARKYFQPLFSHIGQALVKANVSPNSVTVAAFLTGVAGAACFFAGAPLLAVSLLWLSGLLDILDGTVARLTGKTSPFGAFLDLIFDRIVEMAYIVAAALLLPQAQLPAVFLLCSIIFSFSIFLASGALIKITTEKAFYYQAGLAERAETIIFLTVVILFPAITVWTFYVFTAMIVFTGLQRLREVYRYCSKYEVI